MKSRDDLLEQSGIVIRLLGPLALERHGKPLGYGVKKGLALLAYLCLRSGGYAPRETLVGLLWADAGEDQARASLRQTLSGLRKALGGTTNAVVSSNAAGLSLAHAGHSIDLMAFDNLCRAGDLASLKSAAVLCRGDLLEGFPPVTPDFDRWLDAERSSMRTRVMAMLLRLTDAADAAGETDEEIASAHRLIVLDPLQEYVHRRLMRAYMRQKRHDAALRQFETLKVLLAAELGVAPEPETLDLFKEIRRQRASPAKPDAARPGVSASAAASNPAAANLSGRPAVAVLPFKSLTAGDDAVLFGEAISEEIIVELGRETALLVVSRGSSFQFSLADADAAEIGRNLGVKFLLGGSAHIVDDKVCVTAHLVHCETGREIWAERHDRALNDIFEIQTDIARTVTATVVGRIAEAEGEAALHRPFESLESYSLAAKGYRHFLSYNSEGYETAIACFDRAVALDPGFARSWGLLALLNIYQRWYFEMRTDIAEFLPNAEKAIQLDPRDAKGHCALGVAICFCAISTRRGCTTRQACGPIPMTIFC